MSRFEKIDQKLKIFSEHIDATLRIDRDWDPNAGFEERRIDWVENEINKAIIIQPTFKINGVDSSIWNFINLAWVKKNGVAQKPGWRKELIKEKDFREIEMNIDNLLYESYENLKKIKNETHINK